MERSPPCSHMQEVQQNVCNPSKVWQGDRNTRRKELTVLGREKSEKKKWGCLEFKRGKRRERAEGEAGKKKGNLGQCISKSVF